jgi:hypothetical protein
MRLPPQPLNHEQRQRVLALLALGSTRRMACKYVGCRVLDLTAEIKCDRDFKQQVRQQELLPEIEILRSLLAAARDPKQWRAASWTLERFYPYRYAPRKGDAVRPTQLQSMLSKLDQGLAKAIPDPERRWQLLEQCLGRWSRPRKSRPRKSRRTKPTPPEEPPS